ncbi:hypothetical protein ATANTOWER_028881 [Ataeniobius toweri]|uniref:Uncharacterized protein n=1 Tax=Ataeniobius toweri TaxID=208326 RepID=A0ABU7B5S4_9TELE|nr:hypothetical protein [Ataeniobius toweri]
MLHQHPSSPSATFTLFFIGPSDDSVAAWNTRSGLHLDQIMFPLCDSSGHWVERQPPSTADRTNYEHEASSGVSWTGNQRLCAAPRTAVNTIFSTLECILSFLYNFGYIYRGKCSSSSQRTEDMKNISDSLDVMKPPQLQGTEELGVTANFP